MGDEAGAGAGDRPGRAERWDAAVEDARRRAGRLVGGRRGAAVPVGGRPAGRRRRVRARPLRLPGGDPPPTLAPPSSAPAPPGDRAIDAGAPGEPAADASAPGEPAIDAGAPGEPAADAGAPGGPTADAGAPGGPTAEKGAAGRVATGAFAAVFAGAAAVLWRRLDMPAERRLGGRWSGMRRWSPAWARRRCARGCWPVVPAAGRSRLGGATFVVSDALVALRQFGPRRSRVVEAAVMVTYAAAQALLVKSLAPPGHRPRPAYRQSSRGSADEDDLERAGAVHALDPVQLDVAGRRRAADPGQRPGGSSRASASGTVCDDLVGPDHAEVVVGDQGDRPPALVRAGRRARSCRSRRWPPRSR